MHFLRVRDLKLNALIGAAFVALCSSAEAQQQAKTAKIGEMVSRGQDRPGLGTGRELFRRSLLDLGYVEGKNITFETRSAEGNVERFPALAEELVCLKVDVLVASSTLEALAFKNANRSIPIVYVGPTDPVTAGLVNSLARPGGNITGYTNIAPVLAGKRLELLKETIPKLSRVALLWDPQTPASAQQWKESQLPARELGLQLHSMEVSSVEKYESAFSEAIKARTAALAVTANALYVSSQKQIVNLAAKNRLPAIFERRDFVESGGLISYGPDRTERYRRAAIFVDKILKGANPTDIPVEQPTTFEFVINLKAAKQIGVTVPPNVLAPAKKVIR